MPRNGKPVLRYTCTAPDGTVIPYVSAQPWALAGLVYKAGKGWMVVTTGTVQWRTERRSAKIAVGMRATEYAVADLHLER